MWSDWKYPQFKWNSLDKKTNYKESNIGLVLKNENDIDIFLEQFKEQWGEIIDLTRKSLLKNLEQKKENDLLRLENVKLRNRINILEWNLFNALEYAKHKGLINESTLTQLKSDIDNLDLTEREKILLEKKWFLSKYLIDYINNAKKDIVNSGDKEAISNLKIKIWNIKDLRWNAESYMEALIDLYIDLWWNNAKIKKWIFLQLISSIENIFK